MKKKPEQNQPDSRFISGIGGTASMTSSTRAM